MPIVLKSRKQVATLPTLPAGRVYFVVAPFSWGKSPDPVKAVKIARSQYSESLAGPFKFLVHDAPADTYMDDYGHSWTASADKAVLVATYRTKPTDY